MSTGDRLTLLSAFLRHPGRVGAVAPSSVHLARAITNGLAIGPAETVVEFGPGTGSFTAEIRRLVPSPACYLGIELEPSFVGLLRVRYPDLPVVAGSAEDALRHVGEAARGPVRAIVCALPFASLPDRVQDRVIEAIDRLIGPGAEFRTFQYIHAYALPAAVRFRRRMEERLGRHERLATVWRNIPPAFVLAWRREGDPSARPAARG
jgi:phospholipid N-methyltransferase